MINQTLNNAMVAFSDYGVQTSNHFSNISVTEFLHKLKLLTAGAKDGSHFLRTSLQVDASNKCFPRSNAAASSMANMLILDCDKRVSSNGEIIEGAPDPYDVSQILMTNKIWHVLYGSYSHYTGEKGNRYRIVLFTDQPYTHEQLEPTVEALIALINSGLDSELLANATENLTWSQPWYLPRKPVGSDIKDLYIEYTEGHRIAVRDPISTPTDSKQHKRRIQHSDESISPIHAFNQQYTLADLLIQYGYKKVYISKDHEKWISPNSTSGIAGIAVRGDKFFSHHDDKFNDGYWHDAFDLMRISEGLSESQAIIKAAQNTITPDGRTVDEYNKSTRRDSQTAPSNPIPHAKILNELLSKIPKINFRKAAEVSGDDEKLKRYHYYIIAIEIILDTAKRNHWGMCRNHDFIYLYNGSYWNLLDKETLKSFLGEAAEKMGIDKFYARDFNFRDQLYKQFIAAAHLPKPEQPKDTIFVNLNNGTFEITPTGTRLKPFNCDDFLTYQLPFKFDPDAVYPKFQEYLDKVLPTKALQNILAEYLGYVFIRSSTLKLEQALILFGSGANGKSVFYEVVTRLFGDENIATYSLQTLTNDSGYQRAMIANKLVNYASEINGKLEASIFKQLVSGEPVEARLPYGNPFIMSDYAKLIFNCNELPWDVEHTRAFYRRFLIIPFEVTIPESEQDKELAKKIIDDELSGVFNWVLEGLKRLLKQKRFTDCEAVQEARSQYEKESDSVRLFLDETGYVPCDENPIKLEDIYCEYKRFCLEDGYHSVSKIKFRKRVEGANIKTDRSNTGKVVYVRKSSDSYKRAKWGA